MISIKKNRAPILPQCKFLCDGKLDTKLDDYELTKLSLNTSIYRQT